MKITLQVDDREITFSEQELIAIVRKYYSGKEISVPSAEAKSKLKVPEEGIPFEVNPLSIDQVLFQARRKEPRQECTRKFILEAFDAMKEHPEKYKNRFYTLVPQKIWDTKTARELEEFAYKAGGHEANYIEQALEWAQRLFNGESWFDLCNKSDTANWHRAVIWKTGFTRLVGGALSCEQYFPAAFVSDNDHFSSDRFNYAVPLIVFNK